MPPQLKPHPLKSMLGNFWKAKSPTGLGLDFRVGGLARRTRIRSSLRNWGRRPCVQGPRPVARRNWPLRLSFTKLAVCLLAEQKMSSRASAFYQILSCRSWTKRFFTAPTSSNKTAVTGRPVSSCSNPLPCTKSRHHFSSVLYKFSIHRPESEPKLLGMRDTLLDRVIAVGIFFYVDLPPK